MKILLSLITLASAVNAAPSIELEPRGSYKQFCGQWDSTTFSIANSDASYIVYNNLWGESSAQSGSQCTTVTSISGNEIAWKTNWSWEGSSSKVKSYANVAYQYTPKQLSAISTISTKWTWGYNGSSVDANVAYDMFTGSTSGAQTNEYEIMIWLAALGGAAPITSTGYPIATPNIEGVKWTLFSGSNGVNNVFSFAAATEQTSFNGDLKKFFNYLVANEGLSSSQYLNIVEAGTEPFTGSEAQLKTTEYSITVT